ncbi:Aldo/keto reductase [Stereum hirsutum FP-91666 SS1]|uniref:Aldo/keto reductase n=1 Tax=Stereum hirsutum (strain FP-91666) TaxID=721885 RepID=UPI000440E573|nr:Aldo/keto reductase [Stereum hirsutum FP-91666 SS1]EIM89119.1 Aldo/keto reductase [Stereum hirsutum FP-91666 SS1]
MPASTVTKLNTGAEMPTLGLGTWKSQPGAVEHAVETALKAGYKHIDTAAAYGNEAEVGHGIKASGVPRSSFFLTTKLNNNDHTRAYAALEESLAKLETDYLDLWLMHWPAPMTKDLSGADRTINWIDTWKEMEKIYKAHPEKVKAIGVSNVSPAFLELLLKEATVIPAVNQIERHPSCLQTDVLEACKKNGIVVTAYSPLGSDNSPLHENAVIKKIADKYSVTPANVLISFQANTPNVNVLAKSVTPARIEANLKVIDLTEEEMKELEAIDKAHHFRVCAPDWTGWGSLGFVDC